MGRRPVELKPVSDQCWALFRMGLAAERKTEERRVVRQLNCLQRYGSEKLDANRVLHRIFQLFTWRDQNSHEMIDCLRLRKAVRHRCKFEGTRRTYCFCVRKYVLVKIRNSFYVIALGETMCFRRPEWYWNALYVFRVKGNFEPSIFDVNKRLAAIRKTDIVMLSTMREVFSFRDSKLGLHEEMLRTIVGLGAPRSMYTRRDAYQLFQTMVVCLRHRKVKK